MIDQRWFREMRRAAATIKNPTKPDNFQKLKTSQNLTSRENLKREPS
jgi:hypothetical protein